MTGEGDIDQVMVLYTFQHHGVLRTTQLGSGRMCTADATAGF